LKSRADFPLVKN